MRGSTHRQWSASPSGGSPPPRLQVPYRLQATAVRAGGYSIAYLGYGVKAGGARAANAFPHALQIVNTALPAHLNQRRATLRRRLCGQRVRSNMIPRTTHRGASLRSSGGGPAGASAGSALRTCHKDHGMPRRRRKRQKPPSGDCQSCHSIRATRSLREAGLGSASCISGSRHITGATRLRAWSSAWTRSWMTCGSCWRAVTR